MHWLGLHPYTKFGNYPPIVPLPCMLLASPYASPISIQKSGAVVHMNMVHRIDGTQIHCTISVEGTASAKARHEAVKARIYLLNLVPKIEKQEKCRKGITFVQTGTS